MRMWSCQVIYQLSTASGTFMSFLKLFLDDADHSLIEVLVLFSLFTGCFGVWILSLCSGVHDSLVFFLLAVRKTIRSELLCFVLWPLLHLVA